jgi:hypothetical protein
LLEIPADILSTVRKLIQSLLPYATTRPLSSYLYAITTLSNAVTKRSCVWAVQCLACWPSRQWPGKWSQPLCYGQLNAATRRRHRHCATHYSTVRASVWFLSLHDLRDAARGAGRIEHEWRAKFSLRVALIKYAFFMIKESVCDHAKCSLDDNMAHVWRL